MNWAAQRRFTIVAILVAVALVILAIILTATFYKAPSCVDNKQNQDEVGVDCGGSCPYLCTSQEEEPSTPTPRLLINSAGRVDLVAQVQNRNSDAAAKDVPYAVKIYDSNLTFVKEITGYVDLPPRATVPVFIPGVVYGGQPGMRASLSIASTSVNWYRVAGDPRIVPKIDVQPPSGTTSAPRVGVVLSNATLSTLTNVRLVAYVRNSLNGNVVAASATVVPMLAPQGSATAIFTWNEPFAAGAVSVEVLPVIPLP